MTAIYGIWRRMIGRKVMSFAIVMLCMMVSLLSACKPQDNGNSADATALNHIRASREITCGYLVYSPYIRKDLNTGEISGIFYDIMEQIGRNAGLQIKWAEEVGYQNIMPGLDAGRYEVFCGGLWPNAGRALAGSFSQPAFYSTVLAWVRADDNRFQTLDDIAKYKAKLSVIDGAIEDSISKTDFPELEVVSLPDTTPFTQNFMNVTSHKADVVFAEPSLAVEFLANNRGTLRSLGQDKPVRVYSNSLVVRKGDVQLREFLDYAMQEIVYSGQMDKILKKYEVSVDDMPLVLFPRVALPYEVGKR